MPVYKAPKTGVIRLRHDPMALLKQLAITFTGLVVVTASMLLMVYTYGDSIDAAPADAAEAADGPVEVPEAPSEAPTLEQPGTEPLVDAGALDAPVVGPPSP